MRPAGPVARAGQLRAGDQLSCRVAECRGDLGEVGGHGGGLDVGEGLGLAGLVGVSDDGDPGQVPREHIGGGVADQDALVARFGAKFDAQGVLAGSKDSARCIGYLTKYLTKQLGDCHQPDTDAQREHMERLADAAVRAVLTDVRELAALWHPAEEPPPWAGARHL